LQSKTYTTKKQNKIMAEIIENKMDHHEIPSMAKANAGLTLGIIGTALGALNGLGNGNGLLSGLFGGCGGNCSKNAGITNEELYIERSQAAEYLATTKQYYEGMMQTNKAITDAFFDSYKRDVDNSFMLYKSQRDADDVLAKRIDEVDKKVDVMAAIRPYQDALINCKIDNVAANANYNLEKRTCKMISGQLVLPSTPTITGYGSYYPCQPTTPTA
jgi:hypothetical protein